MFNRALHIRTRKRERERALNIRTRKREREKDIEREKEKERETDRQTDRETVFRLMRSLNQIALKCAKFSNASAYFKN